MTRRVLALFPAALVLLAFHHSAAATGPQGLAFVPTAGCRAVDTRLPAGPNGGPSLGADEVRVFKIQGTCGVPASALGLAVNVTVVNPSALGYAQLFAGDAPVPSTIVLAFRPHKTRAGFALVKLSSDGNGTVALANGSSGPADFLIDVVGYIIPACTSTITVTNPGTAAGTVNTPFSQTFTSAGGVGTKTFSTSSPLPAGLTLAANGTLAGTPTQSGSFPIVVTATDANGCKGFGATYTLVISCQTITVTNPAVSTGTANVPFSQMFTQTGGFGTTTFSTASPLPMGMNLAANGVLSGTPTQAGGFDIVVVATDANGCTGAGATYHLVIGCQTISVTNPGVTAGTAGTPFSQMFTQTGAIGAATFTLASGALPSGLFLAPNGLLSGTPTAVGVFPITVKVTDGNLCTGTSATYTLVVGCQTISVTNPATTTGTVDSAFSQTFTQTGALGPATFTTASPLPNGVTLATNGVLSGTPTQPGTFPIVVTVTDANGCTGTGATYVLVVACQTFSVQPTSIPPGTAGTPYPALSFKHAGGHDPVAFTETGALPSGMNFVAGLLIGTPTQTGSFPFTVTATDVNGCTASRDYVLVVSCVGVAITLAPASLPTVIVGSPFPTTTFTGSGGTGGYTFQQIGPLPTGMQFVTDTLSGTPTQTGAFPITIVATDAAGCVGSQEYVVTVTCVGVTITVDPPTVPSLPLGSPFGPVTFTASGGTAPYTFVKTGVLPPGMFMGPDTLSGSPTQNGTFPFTITATDASGCSGSTNYSLVITCPTITVTNPATTTGIAGTAFSQVFTQTGGSGTMTFSTTSTLPTGLTLDADGTLHGTTTQTGTFPIVVKATDSNGCTGTGATYVLVISCQTITITNPGVNTGTVDAPFSQTFTATGLLGTATWSETGALPVGVTLNPSTGTLSGTPTVPGSFPITVKVTDANGCFATSSYTLTVNCQTITVTKPAVTSATYTTAFSQTFTQTGAHGTATFTTASALPTGLALSTAGVLSGTPTQTGAFPIVVIVTDANGCTGTSSTYTLAVVPKLTAKSYTDVGNTQLVGGVPPPATPSVSVVAVSNGDTSDTTITYAVTALPTHGILTTFNSNGTFLYTPNAGNTAADSFTYTGTSNGVSATQTATIGFSGLVWYVDNASGGSHDGRSNTPFTTMTAVGGAATNNGDFIYVAHGSGSTTGTYAMKPSQQLIGAGATLSVGGILTVTGSAANTPTLSGTLTLASSAVVNGIDMSTGATDAITAPGAVTTGFSVTARTVTTTTGAAVRINSAGTDTGTFTFQTINVNGAFSGIVLHNFTGAFTVNGTGGLCDSTHTSASDCTGGTIQNVISRGADILTVQNGGSTSVTLKNMYFKGDGTTNSGGSCVDAINSGSNATCNAAIHMGGASNIVLDHLYLDGTGSADMGLNGNTVSVLTATNIEIANFTGNLKDAAVFQNLTGTTGFTALSLHNNTLAHNFFVTNNTGTANITFTSPVIQNSPLGGVGQGNADGINAQAYNAGTTLNITSTGGTFNNIIGNTTNWAPNSGAHMTAILTGGTSTSTGGIYMASTGTNTQMTYTISGLTSVTTNATGSNGITVGRLNGTNISETGTITNNVVNVGSSSCSTCSGVVVNSYATSGLATITVSNNTIGGNVFNAINVVGAVGGNSLNLTVQGNTLSTTQTSANDGYAIDITSGGAGGDTNCMFVNLGDMSPAHSVPANKNTIPGSNWVNGPGGNTISLAIFDNAQLKLSNLLTFTDAGAAAWTGASNTNGGTDAFHFGTNNFGGGAVCP